MKNRASIYQVTRFTLKALLLASLLSAPWSARAITGTDGGPPNLGNNSVVSVSASTNKVSVLETNAAKFIFQCIPPTGATLTLQYSGTALNGIDYETMPTSVTIPPLATSVALPLNPKPNRPFSEKGVIVTVTQVSGTSVVLGTPGGASISLIGFEAPRLTLEQLQPGILQLSWWAPVPGYVLQSANDPGATQWATVTSAPAGLQGSNTTTITIAGTAAFFRLMKP